MVLGSILQTGRIVYMHTIGNRYGQQVTAADMSVGLSKHRHSSAPRQLPWLMVMFVKENTVKLGRCTNRFSGKDDHYCLVSLSHDQTIQKSNHKYNIVHRLDCVGSTDEGWLIMVANRFVKLQPKGFGSILFHSLNNQSGSSSATVNFFWNPVSGARVMLPLQFTVLCNEDDDYHDEDNTSLFFKKLVATSAPTSPYCVVVGLSSRGRLALCRPGDKSWTLMNDREIKGLEFCDIEIIDGKLYTATREASEFILVFDIQDQDAVDNVGPPPTYSVETLVMQFSPGPIPSHITDGVVRQDDIYLAKDSTSNQLFMILRRDEDPLVRWFLRKIASWFLRKVYYRIGSEIIDCDKSVIPPKLVAFQVFKLECDANGPRWAEVADLGDRMLFVSKANYIFFSAKNDIDYDSRWKTLDRSCLCYASDNPCLESPRRGVGAQTIEHHTF